MSQCPKCFVIAEIGVNHDGDIEKARRMIQIAREAGADCVKFQSFKADCLATVGAAKADYQLRTTEKAESQQDMLRRLELGTEDQVALKVYAEELGIEFLSSPFDVESAKFLIEIGLRRIKIPSGEITNYPLLKYLSGLSGVNVILSTGMSSLGEIDAAVDVLLADRLHREEVTILHCNTEYPTPIGDVNLMAMPMLANAFGVRVGYSDHTDGIEVPIAAVALGAQVIEKHFTLDKCASGPDHKASLEPQELSAMVRAIRNIELALGDGRKYPSASERKNKPIARKSVVAARIIRSGEYFTESNITTKRPGTGLSPMLWETLLGTPAKKDYVPDEMIEL